jgi:hypothetical protein
MKAKKKPIEEIDAVAGDLLVEVVGMELPSKARLNKMFGSEDSDIQEVVRLLHEDAKVI